MNSIAPEMAKTYWKSHFRRTNLNGTYQADVDVEAEARARAEAETKLRFSQMNPPLFNRFPPETQRKLPIFPLLTALQ